MKQRLAPFLKVFIIRGLQITIGSLIGAITLYIYLMNNRPDLNLWHTVELDEEYTVEKQTDITSFNDYLALEDTLFSQLESDIYNKASTTPSNRLNRFKQGSLADPRSYPKNWNRSFILKPKRPQGGVLLLHGLSDSPYSLRALANTLFEQGYYVLGLRMPGHGTAPSGLVSASWEDMAAAVKLAAIHVNEQVGTQKPMYIVGYSMGAAQAVNYSLTALQNNKLPQVDAMALISPAIGVSGVAALAVWQSRLSIIPGLEKLAWNSIGPEYDPYKYNSFAVNAGDQMYRLTQEINKKLLMLNESGRTAEFPRILALMSVIDATVSTQAVVTNLLDKVDNEGNELAVFDINRNEGFTPFLIKDPIEDLNSILKRSQLKFDLTLFTDEPTNSNAIYAKKWFRSGASPTVEPTGEDWPNHVYSLSHVALPFPPTDSLYGSMPENNNSLHIGQLETKGEKGLLNISASDMLRIRYNPFYENMQQQIIDFITHDN